MNKWSRAENMRKIMVGKNLNNIEAFQLKECYDLAAQFEMDIKVKDLLIGKSEKIDIPENYVPIQTNVSFPETEMQILSDAMYELTMEDPSSSGSSPFRFTQKINNLPHSAEKEYLLTLLSLRNGNSENYRIEARKHIQEALKYSGNDPRYIALAEVLQEADK